jgi:phosphatidylglycerophosphate synthase
MHFLDNPPRQIVLVDLRGLSQLEMASGPLTNVCGRPVLWRTLAVFARAGFHEALLLAAPEVREAVVRALGRDGGVRLSITWIESPVDALDRVADSLHDHAPNTVIVYLPGRISFGRFVPELVHGSRTAVPVVSYDLRSQRRDGLARFPLGMLRSRPGLSMAELVSQWEAEGPVENVVQPIPGIEVVDRVSARRAEKALLQSLRKSADGVVAKVDRYVSLGISRWLMHLPIRPNHVTVLAALLGLVCAMSEARGGYFFMLLGALGFQANSILDGIDGEIARAKLLESRLGQWMDTLADDISNLAFMIGVSIGSYRTWGSQRYLVLGGIAATGFILATAFMYHYLITRARSGDLNDFAMPWEEGAHGKRQADDAPTGLIARMLNKVKWAVRRDVYVFLCSLFGLVGQLRCMVWLFALGTTATWGSIFLYRMLLPRTTTAMERAA